MASVCGMISLPAAGPAMGLGQHREFCVRIDVLARAGITLGRDYPEPMVDLDASRKRALAAFAAIKGR